jgi:hypothetical protein
MKACGVLRKNAYLTPDTKEDAARRRLERKNKRRGIKPPPKYFKIYFKPAHYELRKELIQGKQSLARNRRKFMEVYKRFCVRILKNLRASVEEEKRIKFEKRMAKIERFRAFRKRRKKEFAKWLKYWNLSW